MKKKCTKKEGQSVKRNRQHIVKMLSYNTMPCHARALPFDMGLMYEVMVQVCDGIWCMWMVH